MPLFHFSERGDIGTFVPRPVAIPAPRAPGLEWLNDPLVWAIDAWHQPMYLFPRDCPRILVWPVATSSADDRRAFRAITPRRMLAYIEQSWLARLAGAGLHRYTMPGETFESLHDAGMWISRDSVRPAAVDPIGDLAEALDAADVDLRVVPALAQLAPPGDTLHVSAIRLRNLSRAD